MPEQVCFCGLRLTSIEQILYYVGDAVCCNLDCLEQATNGPKPIDRDGHMYGDVPNPER
jgi:hypothetical protein